MPVVDKENEQTDSHGDAAKYRYELHGVSFGIDLFYFVLFDVIHKNLLDFVYANILT